MSEEKKSWDQINIGFIQEPLQSRSCFGLILGDVRKLGNVYGGLFDLPATGINLQMTHLWTWFAVGLLCSLHYLL